MLKLIVNVNRMKYKIVWVLKNYLLQI